MQDVSGIMLHMNLVRILFFFVNGFQCVIKHDFIIELT